MREEEKQRLTVIEKTDTKKSEKIAVHSHQTNPIIKRLLAFRQENPIKFSVKDLFRR